MQEGISISEISKNLNISVKTLCTCHRLYQLHVDKAFQGPDIRLPKGDRQEELRRLKKENTDLKIKRGYLIAPISKQVKAGYI